MSEHDITQRPRGRGVSPEGAGDGGAGRRADGRRAAPGVAVAEEEDDLLGPWASDLRQEAGADDDFDDDDDLMARYLPAARRDRRRRAGGARREAPGRAVAPDLADPDDRPERFEPSHVCSENEEAMLRAALGTFHADHVILDVEARVKGGKEANVYCCRAHPSTGLDLIAAKIYRPRAHRTMRNDALYQEGRLLLDEQGKGVVRDARLKRAVARKTEFGREAMTFSWIEHEYHLLQALHADGADVPRPIGHAGSAILMEYFGEVNAPAPLLSGVRLRSVGEARRLFERLVWHVELLLSHDRVHGDLSPFNVLYAEGRAVVIDFPQAVIASANRNAEWMLQRDVERLCRYFARQGLDVDGEALAADLWHRFETGRL